MRARLRPVAAALAAAGLGCCGGCAATRETHSLSFMQGTWAGEAWGGRFTARYASDDHGVIGYSELTRDGDRAFHEFEVFARSDGLLRLEPFPGGRPAEGLSYIPSASGPRRAVFENPAKDYPTRIVYEAAGGTMTITLDDPHGGTAKREVFTLARAAPPDR